MENKLDGRLGSTGRVGLRNKETKEIIGVYPYKVKGSDEEIEEQVKSWFYPNASENEKHFANGYIDALTYKELMDAKDIFAD